MVRGWLEGLISPILDPYSYLLFGYAATCHSIPQRLLNITTTKSDTFVRPDRSHYFRERRLNHRATTTATVVRRLVSQGMIVLGKTHTVEFACGAWGMNQHRGTPWNPWDAAVPRTPGGSSSGSGVAVAARLAPWALGTDTGCSVRQPAAWCGITGLKTSIGRISTHGILPLSPTLDTPGPMARTVRDVALLFDLLQGPDPLDPRTRGHQAADPMSTLEHGVRGLQLARLPAEERSGVAADVLDEARI